MTTLTLPKGAILSAFMLSTTPAECEQIVKLGEKIWLLGLKATASTGNDEKVRELYDTIQQEQVKNSNLQSQIRQIKEVSHAEVASELQHIELQLNQTRQTCQQLQLQLSDALQKMHEQAMSAAEFAKTADDQVKIAVNRARNEIASANVQLVEALKQEISKSDARYDALKQESAADYSKHAAALAHASSNQHSNQSSEQVSAAVTRARTEITATNAQLIEMLKLGKAKSEAQYDEFKKTSVENLKLANEKHSAELTLLRQSLDPILKFYQTTTNAVQKGENGENRVQKILVSHYPAANIVDMSKVAHSGDMFFEHMGIKCMVEVKNKKVISLSDIEKFHNDVNSQEGKINCALFISILSPNIPHKGDFCIEIHGIPCLYMHMYDDKSMKVAVESMRSIVHTGGEEKDQSTADIITTIFNGFKTTRLEKSRLQKVVRVLFAQIETTKITINNLTSQMSLVSELYKKYPELYPTGENPPVPQSDINSAKKGGNASPAGLRPKYSEEQMSKVSDWMRTNEKIPSMTEFKKCLQLNGYQYKRLGVLKIIMPQLREMFEKIVECPTQKKNEQADNSEV
jgi:hypothetical protein